MKQNTSFRYWWPQFVEVQLLQQLISREKKVQSVLANVLCEMFIGISRLFLCTDIDFHRDICHSFHARGRCFNKTIWCSLYFIISSISVKAVFCAIRFVKKRAKRNSHPHISHLILHRFQCYLKIYLDQIAYNCLLHLFWKWPGN